jgi:hypothetical protein
MNPDQLKLDAVLGGSLMTVPLWALYVLQGVSIVASCIAAVCGAIVGIHAVRKLRKRSSNS